VAGSFGYVAPEVLSEKGHGKPVDIWSTGLVQNLLSLRCSPSSRIITYVLLCGYSPFRSENNKDLVQETLRAHIEFQDRYWKNVSAEGESIYSHHAAWRSVLSDISSAKKFILDLLNADPSQRPTAQAALQHPWLTGHASKEYDLSGLRENFSPRAKWKSAIDAVRAAGRMSALAHSRSHLSKTDTGESYKTDDSGGWDSSSRPSPQGTELRGGATTSDEEEESKGETIGEEWEVKPHRHHPSSSLSSQSQKAKDEHHVPEDAKVSGVSIHEGHAHLIPDEAGKVEGKAGLQTANKDSDDERQFPGAFIWETIKGHIK
jgi:calcium/calmodulin-dependent protein kinase I